MKYAALSALVLSAVCVSAQQPLYAQCGGTGWTGGTTCVSGAVCTAQNQYYSQCVPAGSSAPVASSTPAPASSTAAPASSTAVPASSGGAPAASVTPAADNPFNGFQIYLSPFYASEVSAAAAQITDAATSAAALKVAKIPTFTWFDQVAKVPMLGNMLSDAANIQTSTGQKQIVQIVVYDLPDRDCAALASNGEFSIANNGAANYKNYIDQIAAQVANFPQVKVVAVIEPDSLANLVTNMSVQKCANAAATYKSSVIYAMQKLSSVGVVMYLDAGHAGWLGWPANIQPAAQLFGQLLQQAQTGGQTVNVRGLATNVANYNALTASSPDPITQGNPNFDEMHYINALAPLLQQNNFPAHFVVDQSRSGQQNIRQQWGDWCNVKGSGFGPRPSTNTGSSLIDSIVWVKPGGECDGTSNTSSPRFDAHCGQSDATQPAPEAGSWFQAFFVTLVQKASPAIM